MPDDAVDPFYIADADFTVTFHKANNKEVKTVHKGNLFGPDRGAKLSSMDKTAYLANLVDAPLIRVYDLDAQKWSSFYQNKVISYAKL